MDQTETAASPTSMHFVHTSSTTVVNSDCIVAMSQMESGIFQSCVTSPPYFWQRDYNVDGQIGQEPTVEAYVEKIVEVFACVRTVLRDDGCVWLNLGDSYYSGNGQPCGEDKRSSSRNWMRKKLRPLDSPGMGVPKKSLLGIPWRVVLALQEDGWTVRSEVVWFRDSAFVEPSVKDRPYRQHEMLFLLSKSRRYFFDRCLPEESVWTIPHVRGSKHSAAFPVELAERCIVSTSRKGDLVLDPFLGSGTTLIAAARNGRRGLGIDLNREYCDLAKKRIADEV